MEEKSDSSFSEDGSRCLYFFFPVTQSNFIEVLPRKPMRLRAGVPTLFPWGPLAKNNFHRGEKEMKRLFCDT